MYATMNSTSKVNQKYGSHTFRNQEQRTMNKGWKVDVSESLKSSNDLSPNTQQTGECISH